MSRAELEEAARVCAERCKTNDYCLEDKVICYAMDYIESLESVINKFSTLAEEVERGKLVVEIDMLEGVLHE